MQLRCPKDPTHKRFSAFAHVVENWAVDENGGFIEVDHCSAVTYGPDFFESVCLICGALAEQTDQ